MRKYKQSKEKRQEGRKKKREGVAQIENIKFQMCH